MSQSMDLNAALKRIQELEKENKELKEMINELRNKIEEEDNDVYLEAEYEDEAEWLPLKGFENDYEIFNMYPYQIRKKNNGKLATEGVNRQSGYVYITLNSKSYQKHVLIAKQFIPNPNHLSIVDHKDHDRTNYNISNLRWVSQKDNNRNKSSHKGIQYEFVDNIPDDAITVVEYGEHTFTDYYFINDIFYFYNGINYRKLHVNENKNGIKSVRMIDDDNKNVSVYYSKFKKLYNLN